MSYDAVEKVCAQLGVMLSMSDQLQWDMFIRSHKFSKSSASGQLATLQRLMHSTLASEKFGELVEKAYDSNLDQGQQRNLTFAKSMHLAVKSTPFSLIEMIDNCKMECLDLWRQAVEHNDYRIVSSKFSELIRHTREYLGIRAQALGMNSVYDVALRSFDPDLSHVAVDGFFSHVGRYMSDSSIVSSRKNQRNSRGVFSGMKQEELINSMIPAIFGDKLNIAAVIGGQACNAFYDRDSFMMSIVLAEHDLSRGIRQFLDGVGRALVYVNREHNRFFSGRVAGEIVASLFAVHLMRTKDFAAFVEPYAKNLFAGKNRSCDLNECIELLNRQSCSLNRHDCDEISTLAHLMMRYSIEKELLSGNLSVEDLPDAWAEGSKRYFRAVPKNAYDGCLQDRHWYQGIFGYFPAKATSIMFSHKIYQTMDSTGVASGIAEGNFTALISWIQDMVLNTPMSSQELVSHVCGSNFKMSSYLEYLDRNYSVK